MTIPSEGKRTAAYHINTRQKSKLPIYRLHNMYMKKTLWYFKKPFFSRVVSKHISTKFLVTLVVFTLFFEPFLVIPLKQRDGMYGVRCHFKIPAML